jgi:phage tail-like protein
MRDLSGYLRYLPPVLWSRESDPEQFLGRMLRIFEKMLTGRPDGVPIGDGAPPVEQTIDELPQLFNPWRTRADFLPWLAGWVALDLPPGRAEQGAAEGRVTLNAPWSDYQRRKLIADMVALYQVRGLPRGLLAYLDFFVQTPARPRIAIDDGSSVWRVRLHESETATLTTVARSQVIRFPRTESRPATTLTALIHPSALAVDGENNYFVVDQGLPRGSDDETLRQPALWKLSSTGELPFQATAPLPQPIRQDDFFQRANALVVDGQNRVSVVTTLGEPTGFESRATTLQRLTPPTYSAATIIDQNSTPKLPVVYPVDMVLDRQGAFVILDRGVHLVGDPPASTTAKSKLVIVRETPLSVTEHPLPTVAEPTALLLAPDGALLVADARTARATEPADLVRVDLANNGAATSLLRNVPAAQNPLIFPTGLIWERPNVLLVCDTGLRWGFEPDQSNRVMAEPAALYRVDLNQTPPQITRLTHERTLVNPVKLALDRRGTVLVVDRGEALRGTTLKRNWRVRPNEFGVIVHFSRQRPTTDSDRNQIRRGISTVVEAQKPAHGSWWLKSE